jgi:hypothetical protein
MSIIKHLQPSQSLKETLNLFSRSWHSTEGVAAAINTDVGLLVCLLLEILSRLVCLFTPSNYRRSCIVMCKAGRFGISNTLAAPKPRRKRLAPANTLHTLVQVTPNFVFRGLLVKHWLSHAHGTLGTAVVLNISVIPYIPNIASLLDSPQTP